MSKAGGSTVTWAFSSNIPALIHVGGSVAAGGAAFLIWVAWVMGRKFDYLMETGEVIGGEGQVKWNRQGITGRHTQAKEESTSCSKQE